MKYDQNIFNIYNLFFCGHSKEYESYLDRQIVNMYMLKPHGKGMSSTDIIKLLHIQHKRVKKAVCSFDRKLWRNQKKACNTENFIKRKEENWINPMSGYNKSPKMRHKNNYKTGAA